MIDQRSFNLGALNALKVIELNMYHKAFEVNSDMVKWDSGCWIRYKLFEIMIEEAKEMYK